LLWTFIPIAVLVTISPGPATAMVLRSALRGGWRAGLLTVLGNSIGVVAWGLLSVLGISALVAASEAAFLALKLVGAAVLIWLGVQTFRRAGTEPSTSARSGRPFRDGLVTSLANPKLAAFFVALFPQFIEGRGSVLATTLAMAGLIVVFDVVWYTGLAVAVSRVARGVRGSRVARWVERTTGAVLVALGARMALERA
jgi:threonine/homoserine/homoserine lactone efflux protein